MLAIARALMADPKLLLVDEMSLGLMPVMVDKVLETLKKINVEKSSYLTRRTKSARGTRDS